MIIVGCIISYKEGTLIQGAIRSLFPACSIVYVFEGPCQKGAELIQGTTELGKWKNNKRVVYREGVWKTDSEKRNDVLIAAKLKYEQHGRMKSQPVWMVVLDADELLVWGEYLQDWLSMAPDNQWSIPILRTETVLNRPSIKGAWGLVSKDAVENNPMGIVADKAPSRIVRVDLIDHYVVGCYQIQLKDGVVISLGHQRADRIPQQGEPHVHHRSYLRSPNRSGLRLNKGEEKEWMEKNDKDWGVRE
jgi:hypothetical protein